MHSRRGTRGRNTPYHPRSGRSTPYPRSGRSTPYPRSGRATPGRRSRGRSGRNTPAKSLRSSRRSSQNQSRDGGGQEYENVQEQEDEIDEVGSYIGSDGEVVHVSQTQQKINIQQIRTDIWEVFDIEPIQVPEVADQIQGYTAPVYGQKEPTPEVFVVKKKRDTKKVTRGEFEIEHTSVNRKFLDDDGKEREDTEVYDKLIGKRTEQEFHMTFNSYNIENAHQQRFQLKKIKMRPTECKVIIVYSTYAVTSHEEQAIRRTMFFFEARKFPLEYVDAALMECQERRAVFEKISGLKCWWAPKFPQIFVRLEDDQVLYIGDWDRIQELLDCDGLNTAFVRQNNIATFSGVFGDFIDSNYSKYAKDNIRDKEEVNAREGAFDDEGEL